MKCPKCKYTTFDYLDTCPRCGKDMAAEKANLNIFSIKPNPPFLLGSLTGDLNDSSFGLEAMEPTKDAAEGMELKPEEVYDDGSELNINIDQESISKPDKDVELDIGDLGMPSDDKELELDVVSDNITLEIKEEAVKTEDVSQEEAGLEETADKESVQKEEAGKDVEEMDLESEDLELNLDLDEEKNIDEGPISEPDKDIEPGVSDLDSSTSEEGADKASVQKEEAEKGVEEMDLEVEDLELNLDLEDDEDTKK